MRQVPRRGCRRRGFPSFRGKGIWRSRIGIRILSPPARRARLPHERPRDDERVGRVQRAASSDGTGAHRVVARIVGGDARINHSILQRMLGRAVEFHSGSARAVRHPIVDGFRPATPDKLPLIGPWDATPGLWIAAGHEGLGITTSLATARAHRRPARGPCTGDRPVALLAIARSHDSEGFA